MASLNINEFNNSISKINYYIKEIDKSSNDIKKSFIKINGNYNTPNKDNMEKADELIFSNMKKMIDNYKNYVFVMNKNINTYKDMELKVSESFENIQ